MMMLTMTTFMAVMLTQCSAMDKAKMAGMLTQTERSKKANHRWKVALIKLSFMETLEENLLKQFEKKSELMLIRKDCDRDLKTYIDSADGKFDNWLAKGVIAISNSIGTYTISEEKKEELGLAEFDNEALSKLILAYGKDKEKKRFTEVLTSAKKIILDNRGEIALKNETQKHDLMGAAKIAWNEAAEKMKCGGLTKKDICLLIKAHYKDYFSEVKKMWNAFTSNPLGMWRTVKNGWKKIKEETGVQSWKDLLKIKLKHFGKTEQEIKIQARCSSTLPDLDRTECKTCGGKGKKKIIGCLGIPCKACEGTGKGISVSERSERRYPELPSRRRLINRMLREIRRAQNLA